MPQGAAKALGVGLGAVGLGAVGMDPLTYTPRSTFGTDALKNGVSFVAVMIGMSGISEGLAQLHTITNPGIKQKIGRIVPP